MKIFKGIISCAIFSTLIVFSIPALAGTGSGLIRDIVVNPGGTVTFRLDVLVGGPHCGSKQNFPNDFAFDGSTAEGRSKLAVLISAANAKKNVYVIGTGNCSAWGDRETASTIKVDY